MSVRMHHPGLPGQEIEVPDSAVPHHGAAGWVVVEDDAPEPAPAAADEAEEPKKTTPAPKQRRTVKED